MSKKQLSIVIPAYNEQNAIVDTIKNILSIMDKSDIEYEIIVVNDGSKDKTKEYLEKYFQENPQIHSKLLLFSHIINKGYGATLKTGIRKAKYSNICITDSDGTYPNQDIPMLFAEYEKEYDMVVGQRSFKSLPKLTKPTKWFLHKLANFLVGYKIPDINSGLRIFKKEIAMKYFGIICDGFSFTTTITLAMLSNNYSVKYVPIEYFKRIGKSKIKPVKDTLNFIQLIIRTVMYFNPLKIFVPMSFIMLLAAIVLFVLGQVNILYKSPSNTIVVLIVGSIQIFITGMIADLIDKRIEK
ncbi:MAG: glycosyltransferase family 2 protein [Spirochaetae bacterium HGW-Spirochaetae-6]|nr:MAG: glycosyltransferase family 2 protein [Spirochaetae bacterium HGW-Spirochaetae-6]